MLEGIEAVLFDMDGTLIDSSHVSNETNLQILKNHGIEVTDKIQKDLLCFHYRQQMEYMIHECGIDYTFEQMRQEWIDVSMKKFVECDLKKGAFEFVNKLHEMGMKIAIGTNNAFDIAKNVIVKHNIDFFDRIITGANVKKQKPAPDVYLKAAEMLGVEPSKCLVFDDHPDGIRAGKAAGMHVCTVYDKGTEKHDSLKRELADYYINSFDDVLNNTYEKLK